MTIKNCPSQERLLGYSLGTLPPEDARQIEEHVHACLECEGTLNLADGQNDTILSELRKGPPPEIPIVEFPEPSKSQGDGVPAAALVPKPSADAQAGERTLGNYILLEQIGAGGMGQVFKARHRRMDRIVALKLLPAKSMADPNVIARFEREVKAAARLTHPNIVAAFDADQADNVHFLVMEYVQGKDLSALVKTAGPLSEAKAIDCILQAARGLGAAHAEGIVHRDIKPANLLLDKKGIVKILDMGLASIHDDTIAQVELTATGAVMGTVDYMAPEQALDTKTADARADIYSLGCTLFYLLTGRATYQGDTLTARLLAHQGQPIPELRSIRSDVSTELEDIFRKMVAKKIGDRYQSMAELIADLERLGNPATIAFAQDNQSVGSEATRVMVPPAQPTPPGLTSPAEGGGNRRKRLLMCIGAAAAAMILLAVIVIVNRNDGTKLVVEVNEPGAKIVVRDDEGVVEVTRASEKDPVEIRVKPGTHRIVVTKAGFETESVDHVEVKAGKSKPIRVSLDKSSDKVDVKDLATVKPAIPSVKPEKSAPPVVDSPKPAAPEMVVGAKEPAVEPKMPAASIIALETPAFQEWLKVVAEMTANKRDKAVIQKLQELNPGFEGRLERTGAGEYQLKSQHVTDISPLRAVSNMKSLYLECNALKDLSPLKGLPLKSLGCQGVHAADLSPLQGVPLTRFEWSYNNIGDLSQLRGLPLEEFSIIHSPVGDLSFLRGMPLRTIYVLGAHVGDLSPLQGMRLKSLTCIGNRVFDLSPLKGMPLEMLNCGLTSISDLSPLEGMPLKELYFGATIVSDLTPLKGMPLINLGCAVTEVSDLSPLSGMPLTALDIRNTLVKDLSPLEGPTLSQINFTPENISKGIDILREMKNLKSLGTAYQESISKEDFWKKYDAGDYAPKPPVTTPGDPAFQQWVKEVAAMPAEQQAQAVARKLQELNSGFDGQFTHQIEHDEVTAFQFFAGSVKDISPMLALKSLKDLSCLGGGHHSNATRRVSRPVAAQRNGIDSLDLQVDADFGSFATERDAAGGAELFEYADQRLVTFEGDGTDLSFVWHDRRPQLIASGRDALAKFGLLEYGDHGPGSVEGDAVDILGL